MEQVMVRIPLRIDLCTGGDLPSICTIYERYIPTAMNIAIDKYITVTVSDSIDDNIWINGTCYNPKDIDIIGNNKLVVALIKYHGNKPVSINIECDLASRVGLGGSGAVTVALLYALRKYYGSSSGDIVGDAHLLENAVPSCLTGYQDQLAAVYGGFNLWNFHYISNDSVTPLYIDIGDIPHDAIHTSNYNGLRIVDKGILDEIESRMLLFNPLTDHDSKEINTNQVQNYYMVKTSDEWLSTFECISRCFISICRNDYRDAIARMNYITDLRVRDVEGVSSSSIEKLREIAKDNNSGTAICGAGNGFVWMLCSSSNARSNILREGQVYADPVDIFIDREGMSVIVEKGDR
jgi:D-glycero-alpha-D-manno-heptose-7-phosphate kinase